MHPCVLPRGTAARVRVVVRKVRRHPLTQKTLRTSIRIQKKVLRGAVLSVIPSGIDDVVLHHAQLTTNEALQLLVDQATISALSGLMALILVLAKD
jgi:hypothetical protein